MLKLILNTEKSLNARMEIAVRITEIAVNFSDLKNAVKCSKFCDYL